jgi:glycosyltransferase involved in cell wall biosynthesis
MIVTNVGGLPAMVKHGVTGVVTEPDALSIASGIAEAYKLGEEYFLPGLREEKKKYSWKKLVDAIMILANQAKA